MGQSIMQMDPVALADIKSEGYMAVVKTGQNKRVALSELASADDVKVAVFECTYSEEAQGYTYPTYDELTDAIQAGKLPVIVTINATGSRTYFVATFLSSYMEVRYHFVSVETGRMLKLEGTTDLVWSRASVYDDTLSSTSANAVQNSTLYAAIGNVETLLAAL